MLKMIEFDLSLFDGEGAGDGGQAAGETGTPSAAGKGKGEYANVKFGIQEAPQGAQPSDTDSGIQVTSDTLEARRKAYNDLIRGEYKDLYTQDTQKMIDRRFKETKNLEKQVADFQPLMDALSQRYKTSDVAGIMKAMDDDNAYWESAAYEAGFDNVEQYKKVQKLERENKALIEQQRQQEHEVQVQQRVNEWVEQAEQMKQSYPEFDLNAELENQEFQRLLTSGVPVQHAYEVIHMDDIKNSLMQVAIEKTSKAVTDNIRAKGLRPVENGTSAQNAFTVKSDVSKLNRKDREEIARRVARGEVISF